MEKRTKDKYAINRDKLVVMADEIRTMEKAGDYSMRGYYIDELVTNYTETFGEDFVNMFNYIMEHQQKVYDTYGDCDETVTKLKTTGDIVEKNVWTNKNTYSVRAMFLEDVFCGKGFIIVELTESPIEFPEMTKTSYHVHTTDKKHKSIRVMDYIKHDYHTFVLEYKKDFFTEGKVILDSQSKHMLYKYQNFKALIDAIRDPYIQLKAKTEGVDISEVLNK